MKRKNKFWLNSLVLMSVLCVVISSCKKDEDETVDTTTPAITVVSTETWKAVLNYDSLNYGDFTFEKNSNAIVTSKGTWHVMFGGAEIKCPFTDAEVTINGVSVSILAHGTATNPGAATGHQTASFVLNVSGNYTTGNASGTYSITYSGGGSSWPSNMSGHFIATKKSGSGVTN